MIGVDLNRPPYVQWEMQPMEDRDASIKAGHMVMKDVAVALIQRPGSKDVLPKLAAVWLSEVKSRAAKNEVPLEWVTHFEASYKFWLEGESAPVNGTSIKSWPAVSPAQAKNIIAAGIFTVEDLAALPDTDLQILGIGATALKQKACSWIEASTDKGKMAEENAAMKAQLADLQKTVDQLMANQQALKAAK